MNRVFFGGGVDSRFPLLIERESMNQVHQRASVIESGRPPATPVPPLSCTIRQAIEAGRLVHHLPAVAMLDWCDRAAMIAAHCFGPSVCGAAVGTVDTDGRVLDLEATGAAATVTQPGGLYLDTVRCRLQSLASFGFAPRFEMVPGGTLQAPVCVCASRLSELMGDGWSRGGVAEVLASATSVEPVVGWTQLSCIAAGPRRLLWFIIAPIISGKPDSPAGSIELLRVILEEMTGPARRALGTARLPRANWISPREREVLDMLVLGHSVREIAETMSRSPHTVHDHVKSLHRKLNAQSRGELVARALGHAAEDLSEAVVVEAPGVGEEDAVGSSTLIAPLTEAKPGAFISRVTP